VTIGFGGLECLAGSVGDRTAIEGLVRRGFGVDAAVFGRYFSLLAPSAFRFIRSDEGRPIALAADFDLEQWFGGRPVPVRGIAFVTVDPSARGRGLGAALMRDLMEEERAFGAALAILYASTPAFYSGLGFGRAGVHLRYRAPTAAFPRPCSGDRVEARRFVDYTEVDRIRRRFLPWTAGAIERPTALWEHRVVPLGEAGPGDLWTFPGADGTPGGYLFPAPPVDGDLRLYDNGFVVREAARSAAGFIHGFRAQAKTTTWDGGPNDPLATSIVDGGVEIVDADVWYARVLDVERALTTRGYMGGASSALTLRVHDPMFAANDGRFRLTVDEAGVAQIERLERNGPTDLTMSAGGLVPLSTGHMDPASLRVAGLISGDDGAIATASRIFAGPAPFLDDLF